MTSPTHPRPADDDSADQQKLLYRILAAAAEDDAKEQDWTKLNELLRSSAHLRQAYADYLFVHGQLYLDAGLPLNSDGVVSETAEVPEPKRHAITTGPETHRPRRPVYQAISVISAIALLLLITFFGPNESAEESNGPVVNSSNDSDTTDLAQNSPNPGSVTPPGVELRSLQPNRSPLADATPEAAVAAHSLPTVLPAWLETAEFTDDQVVTEIDRLLSEAWRDNEVTPSEEAESSLWTRRLYLTLAGRLPTSQELLAAEAADSRAELVAHVTRLPDTADMLAVHWANQLIGRRPRAGASYEELTAWLSDSFLNNRPWMELVGDMITARGRHDRNPPTNFLLAHLNNQATPATAVTTRVFLGQQVHCVQCHDHPFHKEWTQERFWELNSFFKQTKRRPVRSEEDPDRITAWELTDNNATGMTYFVRLGGQQQAVVPEYAGERIEPGEKAPRRERLAELLQSDPEKHVARAFVNRMWAHCFGAGFTNPIDDMGPHNPVSHPELLATLTEAFVVSGYDTQRLLRWITATQAFHLSSVPNDSNGTDSPDAEGGPLFSRTYARRMSPEQVYNSLRTAIRSAADQPLHRETDAEHRRQWVLQFVESFDTDEMQETLHDGNISQALMMMNGPEVSQALRQVAEWLTARERRDRTPDAILERLTASVLCRSPRRDEYQLFRRHARHPDSTLTSATEDMLWVLLNSGEFVMIR